MDTWRATTRRTIYFVRGSGPQSFVTWKGKFPWKGLGEGKGWVLRGGLL